MKKIKAILKKIAPLINKYTIAVVAFLVIMSLGQYGIINRIKLTRSVFGLEKEKEQYEKDIVNARKELNQVNTSKANLERLAREKYMMRKKNEEVFIINEEEKK